MHKLCNVAAMNYHVHGMAFDAQRAAFPPGAASILCEFFEFTQFPCNREKNELVRRTVNSPLAVCPCFALTRVLTRSLCRGARRRR